MVSADFEFVGAVMNELCIEFTKTGIALWMKVRTCVPNTLEWNVRKERPPKQLSQAKCGGEN
jgi:hypothetical protein